jgi:CRISPR-associated endonuclease/helicase Cas3
LTPHDRAKTLQRVHERLKTKGDNDWSLIATSCVEAGVNLSFRKGFREIASLASLLQAAGRIGRNGEYPDAEILTFILDTSSVFNTNPVLKRAADVLRGYFERNISISAELSTDAVSSELKLRGVSGTYRELLRFERNLCFESVENKFHVIDNDSRLTIVNSDIAAQVKNGKIDWHELQKHSVQVRQTILEKHRAKEMMPGVFLWEYGYDDFLGYMQGVLKMNDVSSCIV